MIKRFSYLLLAVLLLSGCKETKREEALAMINQVDCKKTGISFLLNGLWEIEERDSEEKSTVIELSAKNKETGSHILVFYEEIKQREGGEILREEDYIENIIENLKVSEEYDYSIKEEENITLFKKDFTSFSAKIQSMNATQQYYIYNNNEIITVMVITSYGQEEISDILSLAKNK